MSDAADKTEKIAEEARESFDLGGFLRGATRVMDTVTVYTDEQAGNALGGHEIVQEDGPGGARVPKVRSWGLKGEYNKLTRTPEEKKKNAKRIREVEKEVAALLERIEESALTFELHSIPTAISKSARRNARKELEITGKGVPEALSDEFAEELSSQYLALSAGKVTRGDGKQLPKLSVEEARDLADYLPRSEHIKLLNAVNDVLFASHISTAAVENPDF